MKKLFIFIFCCALMCCDGRYVAHSTSLIVGSIQEPVHRGEGNCYYRIKIIDEQGGVWDWFWYLAPTGKYSVGDTLNLEK